MTAEERQKRIAEYLHKAEFASLEELASHVVASVSTVRRDVIEMAATGVIRRTHGGARLLNPQSDEFAFSRRDTLQLPEKEAIGKAAAGLIQRGESVIVDAGSTVYHVARHLKPEELQIITNSLPVANLFASTQQIEVMVSGGIIYPRLGVLVGPLAIAAFSDMHADVAIMSAGGLTLEGISNSHTMLIDIQRAMIRAAGRVIFCLDHTKFGRRSVSQLCALSEIDTVVTDAAAPMDLVTALRQHGVQVIIAEKTESPATPTPAPIINRERTREVGRSGSLQRPPRAPSEGDIVIAPPATIAPPKTATTEKSPPRPHAPRTVQAQSTIPTESSDSRMGWD